MAGAAGTMEPESFLAWRRVHGAHHELVRGRLVPLERRSDRHVRIRRNIVALSADGVTADLDAAIVCRSDTVRVTDARVPRRDSGRDQPDVLVQVLAPDARAADLLDCWMDYDGLPGVAAFVLLCRDQPQAFVLERMGAHLALRGPYNTLDAVIDLADVGVRLALADVYEGVDFPEPAAPALAPPLI